MHESSENGRDKPAAPENVHEFRHLQPDSAARPTGDQGRVRFGAVSFVLCVNRNEEDDYEKAS